MEKGLKEIHGRSATPLIRARVCVRVFACVRASKILWREVVWISCYQQKSLSWTTPTLKNPSTLSLTHIHTSSSSLSFLTLSHSPFLSFFFLLCFHPAPRPWCEIPHVLTLHYPQHIVQQRHDESWHSPSPLGRHDDGLKDDRDSICICHDVISSNCLLTSSHP